MALPVRKGYKGAPAQAVLTNSPTSGDTSFVVDTVTGWATTFPFYCVVEPGTSREEKVKVTAISGTTLTVVRSQDDTSPQGHNSGSAIYPVFTADEADEANQIASVMTTKGDIIGTDGSSINRLNVGTNTHVLQADSTATNGFKWGQIVEAGIADGAVTSAKIANGTIVEGDLADGAVTSAKILNNTIALGDLATALQAFLVPVGTIAMYAGATAPTGWLLCDGTTSTSGYTALAAIVGGTTPDLKGRVPVGAGNGTGLTARSLGATGGNETHTLGIGEIPSHNHTGETSQNTTSHSHAQLVGLVNYETGPYQAVVTVPIGSSSGTDANYSTGAQSSNHIHSITANGGGGAHNNMQPFRVVNYIIKHD